MPLALPKIQKYRAIYMKSGESNGMWTRKSLVSSRKDTYHKGLKSMYKHMYEKGCKRVEVEGGTTHRI